MHPILKNVLAVVAGIILGGIVNMGVIVLGGQIAPVPDGINIMDPESLKANIDKMPLLNLLIPIIAHALGTLVGAFVTTKIAASHKQRLAMIIGCFFLLGGIQMIMQIGGPLWFKVVDLVFAYLPMAWLGSRLASGK